MKLEKSPFDTKKISIIKLGEVIEYLSKYNRIIWINMCKGSKVRLLEGNVNMGPMPNWKAYKTLCHILTFEQDKAKKKQEIDIMLAPFVADPTKLFITTS